MLFSILVLVFEKKISDLSIFSFCPNALIYVTMISLYFLASSRVLTPAIIVSSTNCKCVTLLTSYVMDILQISFSIWAFSMALPKDYVIMMNRKGEMGSPCLIPLDELKNPSGVPLIKIEFFGVDM